MSLFSMLSPGIGGFTAPVRATFWISIAGVGFTLTITGVRQVTPEIHVLEAVLFRSLFGVMFMIPWMIRQGAKSVRTERLGLYAARGTLAYFVTICYFMAATMVPLADMVSVTFTRPIFGTIAAVIFLNEIAHGRRWTAIGVGFIGMLIIVRPGFNALNIGLLIVLLGVALQTANTLIVKVLTRTESPDTIALYHSAFIVPLAVIPAIIVWQTPNLVQLGWLLGIGATGMLTQRAMSRAFAAADASFVLAMSYLRLPIAALIGYLVFSETPEIWVWIGASIICGSSTYIAHREAAIARTEKQT